MIIIKQNHELKWILFVNFVFKYNLKKNYKTQPYDEDDNLNLYIY